jgi:hypothetical protein
MRKPLSFGFYAIVLAFAAIIVYEFLGYYPGMFAGWAVAHFDLCRGDYRLKVVGLAPPWDQESTYVFAEKYHVKRDRIALCIVSFWDSGYEEGYNSVSGPAIEAKYSKRVFADAMKESIEQYMQIYKPEGNEKEYCEKMLNIYENQ